LTVCTPRAKRFVLGLGELDCAERAVEFVADDRMPDRGHVQTDLMISPGPRPGADQRVPCAARDDFILGARGAPVAGFRTARHQHAAGFGRSADRHIDRSAIARQHALDHRQIGFADALALELNRELAMRQVFLCDDNQPARHAVQPMHDPWPQQAGANRLLIEMMLQRVAQGARLEIPSRMCDLPGRLVDDDQPGILVNNIDRQRLRTVQLVGRLDQPHADCVALVDAFLDRNGCAVDLRLSGRHHPLQPPWRVVAKMPGQKRIDPYAAQVAFDDQFGGNRKGRHVPIVAGAPNSRDNRRSKRSPPRGISSVIVIELLGPGCHSTANSRSCRIARVLPARSTDRRAA